MRRGIVHRDFLNFPGFLHGEVNLFAEQIPGRGGSFGQRIVAGLQALDAVGLAVGFPLGNGVAAGIGDFQFCTGQLVTICHVSLEDFDLGKIVFHLHTLNILGRTNLKGNALGADIALLDGSHRFGQGVSSHRDALHIVRCAVCNPFSNGFAVCIRDFQLCAADFLAGGNVGLGNLHFRVVVLHDNVLDLAVILDCELNGIGRHIPGIIGYERFLQCVGFARNQHSLHVVRRIFGHPFVHNIAVFIQHTQRGTGDFFVGRNIGFADFYAGGRIQHRHCLAESIRIFQQNPACRVGDFGIGGLFCNLLIGKERGSRRAVQIGLVKRQVGEVALPQAFGNRAVVGGIGEIHHQRAVHAVPVGNDNAVCIGILAQQLIPESVQLGGNRSHGIVGKRGGGDNAARLVCCIFGFMQNPDRRFLQVGIIVRGLLQAELNRAGGGIAVCRTSLGQGIDF